MWKFSAHIAIHIAVYFHCAALQKTLSSVGSRLHKVRSRHTVLSVCWLDMPQSNIVDGSGVLTNRVLVQEKYCFQVQPVAIIQWQGNIHTRTHPHAHTHTRAFRALNAVMQYNLKTPHLLTACPTWKCSLLKFVHSASTPSYESRTSVTDTASASHLQ